MQSLKTIKLKLTMIFLSSVIGVILLIGITFLITKLIDSKNKDTEEVRNITAQISTYLLKNDIKDFQLSLLSSPRPKGKNNKPQRERIPVNIIVFNQNGEIIKDYSNSSLRDAEEIQSFFVLKEKNEIFEEQDHAFQFIKDTKGNHILIFKFLRYSQEDFFFDMFIFILFIGIFSFPLFFLVRYFIDLTLLPVEENMKDMQDFVHNAGHELKTPLAVMHGNLQIEKELAVYDEFRNKEMISEIEKMNQLIEGLVELSSIKSTLDITTFSLYDEIQSITGSFEHIIKEKMLDCAIENQGDTQIKANKGHFYILFSNIFLNAIKYNIKGGKIMMSVRKNMCIIEDTGIGIEKEYQSKIFERFFKVDTSRNSSGFGIGLSLVKKVADIYSWKIRVKSEKGKGTIFEIFF